MTKRTVTQEQVDNFIKEIQYIKLGEKTTVCRLVLVNGFEITSTSACVHPENYRQEIGEEVSLRRAKDQVWGFLGFLLQHEDYLIEKHEYELVTNDEREGDQSLLDNAHIGREL